MQGRPMVSVGAVGDAGPVAGISRSSQGCRASRRYQQVSERQKHHSPLDVTKHSYTCCTSTQSAQSITRAIFSHIAYQKLRRSSLMDEG